ncbi:MAG: uroporphyrinogen decarboxylase family protein [Candidatus Aminicenantales bacterium]
MNSKERVIAAINHQTPDRIPLNGSFRQDVWSKLEDYFGTKEAETIRARLGLDIRTCMMEPSASFAQRSVPSPWQIPEIGMGKNNLVIIRENGWLEDEYGICRLPNRNRLYWLYAYHPLAEASLEEVRKYKFPDPNLEERYQNIRQDVVRFGDNYFTLVELWNIFKTSWELRGFERYLLDLRWEPKLVETLADRVLGHRIEQSKQIVKCGVDMLFIMGDIAMQNTMMLSPSLWRRYFKPRLKIWIQEIRRERPDLYFMFHSDGNIESVFEDLIEIGFEVIDPIQPESMDVIDIKRRFGDRVCLHGTISCQKTLPYGTVEEVAAEVIERIEKCAKDGGLILAPSNTVQPDVSVEKILTLYETARNVSLG